MAEKMYKGLDGQRYRGVHNTYYGKGEMGRKAGEVFSEKELFGNPDTLEMSLEGSDDDIRMKKDKDGSKIKGSEYVAIRGKEPKIELVKPPVKKGKKK